MGKDRLTHARGSQELRTGSIDTSAARGISPQPPLQNQANTNQQLRGGQDGGNEYKSEDHHHVYQNQSRSFNDQRDNYAEQALNEYIPPSYDYQAVPTDGVPGQDYHRYTANNTPSAGVGSIFISSDIDLADATGNYLEENSEKFREKMDMLDQKALRAADKIKSLESKSLEYRNKPWKHRLIIDEERGKRVSRESWHSRNDMFDRIHVEKKTRIIGRLKFQSEKIALTGRKHHREMRKGERKFTRGQFYRRQLYGTIRDTISGSDFGEDDVMASMRGKAKKTAGTARFYIKRKYRKLKHELDGYNRLKYQKARLNALRARQQRLSYNFGIDFQKRKAEEAVRQGLNRDKRKRKLKKEMVWKYKHGQGSFFTRMKNQHKLKKTIRKEKRMAKKRIKTLISSISGITLFIAIGSLLLFTLVTLIASTSGESMANTASQNSYYDMTEVTAYFRDKEAELEEYIKPENLEPVILEEYPEIFEFIYDMDEINFDANTLVAYLSAKYNEFTLEMTKEDLDEIFKLYYTLEWEVKEEYRMLPDDSQPPDPDTGEYPMVNMLVQICYVSLKKADFYELLQGRIEDAAKQGQMNGFYLAGNGQQIYGPVMNMDWRNKISSNYGWRVHPITGKRTFHDGVDIAVPIGTALYSTVKGTVVDSHYSDSAGHMVVVESESGWRITFMHMDSRAVSVGERIKQGQFVGCSGNTGNSTGPHLHIRIHDAEDKPVNPVFLVPFSTTESSETF